MPERIHAPDLTAATAWLNVDRPIAIRELRGHVVILDFWTYCCINCMHVLPLLRDLVERHAADPLVVIGVHSGKFDAEKDAARIEAAMRRYGVSHP
ncbi:MAG: thioredoxin-like domain-containing protein, partial [Myxococcales bacterium]